MWTNSSVGIIACSPLLYFIVHHAHVQDLTENTCLPPAVDPILAQQDVEVYHSDWHHRLKPDVASLKNKTIRLGSKCRNLSHQSIAPSVMMQPSSKRLNNKLNERTRHIPQAQPEGKPLRTSFTNSFFGQLLHRIIEYSPGAKVGG